MRIGDQVRITAEYITHLREQETESPVREIRVGMRAQIIGKMSMDCYWLLLNEGGYAGIAGKHLSPA